MKSQLVVGTAIVAFLLVGARANAATIYLNGATGLSVALGPEHGATNPFEQSMTIADALENVIDAPTALSTESHSSGATGTHVWVSGEPLFLRFDLGDNYNLTSLHFWNYDGEDFDVDEIQFEVLDASSTLLGSPVINPALGSGGAAEDFAFAFNNARFVRARLSGSNNEVDFLNLGFTGEEIVQEDPNGPRVPEPATLLLLALGAAGVTRAKVRRRA